jgi:peptidoglycan lytic transglycosylase G
MEELLTKKQKIKLGLMMFSAVMVISFSFYFYQVIFAPNILVGQAKQEVLIPSGTTFNQLLKRLDQERIIQDQVSFAFVAKLMNYQEAVKPGNYEFQTGMTNIQVIRMLRGGMQKPVQVTLNNVRIPEELAEKVCWNILLKPEEFLQSFQDPLLQKKYGFDSSNFLAMFLPNTYEIYWNISAVHFLNKMKEEYDQFWTSGRKAKSKALGLTPIEVSVLASIVQAETNIEDEKPIIAGVYLNRIKRNMKLQADPTVVYAIGDFDLKRVLKVHKEVESPYNTYKYAGLPPGPINLPEIGTLKAVLNARKNDYLYFCAKEDFSGRHNFASNLRDHQNNARRYQAALNKRRIY